MVKFINIIDEREKKNIILWCGTMAKEFRIIMNEKPDWDKICMLFIEQPGLSSIVIIFLKLEIEERYRKTIFVDNPFTESKLQNHLILFLDE